MGSDDHDERAAYWDRVADDKSFTHELDLRRFAAEVPRDARICDVGCGYGRTLATLAGRGYRELLGFDASAAMIRRGLRERPELDLRHLASDRIPLADASQDAALLLAVLTCVPGDEEQRALVAELVRVLRPGGTLWVTDVWIQTDERHVARYGGARPHGAPRGVFRHEEGVVFRHHDRRWIEELFGGSGTVDVEDVRFRTMNGNGVEAFRLLLRRDGHRG
ncbi:MAG: class I SAM-dependent methyltransferase [Planctomycetota bacterium]